MLALGVGRAPGARRGQKVVDSELERSHNVTMEYCR